MELEKDVMLENLRILAEKVPQKCLTRVPVIPGFKTKNEAEKEVEELKKIGFKNIDLFEYVIR